MFTAESLIVTDSVNLYKKTLLQSQHTGLFITIDNLSVIQ